MSTAPPAGSRNPRLRNSLEALVLVLLVGGCGLAYYLITRPPGRQYPPAVDVLPRVADSTVVVERTFAAMDVPALNLRGLVIAGPADERPTALLTSELAVLRADGWNHLTSDGFTRPNRYRMVAVPVTRPGADIDIDNGAGTYSAFLTVLNTRTRLHEFAGATLPRGATASARAALADGRPLLWVTLGHGR